MKSNNLQTIEDLIQENAQLKAQLKNERESKNYWIDSYNSLDRKFKAFSNLVKGLITLTDK